MMPGKREALPGKSGNNSMAKRAFWKGRRVLVTGGAGFIGYALALRLAHLGARASVVRSHRPYDTRQDSLYPRERNIPKDP